MKWCEKLKKYLAGLPEAKQALLAQIEILIKKKNFKVRTIVVGLSIVASTKAREKAEAGRLENWIPKNVFFVSKMSLSKDIHFGFRKRPKFNLIFSERGRIFFILKSNETAAATISAKIMLRLIKDHIKNSSRGDLGFN